MKQILIGIYDFFEKRRLVFFVVFATSFLLLGYFSLQVTFEEDISKILPKDKKIEELNESFQNSKFMDKLVVTVSLKDTASGAQPDSLVTYAGVLAEKLREKLSPYMSKINDKVDDDIVMELFGTVSDHLPVYLDKTSVRNCRRTSVDGNGSAIDEDVASDVAANDDVVVPMIAGN